MFIQIQYAALDISYIVGALFIIHEPMTLQSIVPNTAQTKLSMARRVIEPVTFALLARRSNQLS